MLKPGDGQLQGACPLREHGFIGHSHMTLSSQPELTHTGAYLPQQRGGEGAAGLLLWPGRRMAEEGPPFKWGHPQEEHVSPYAEPS